MTEEIEPISDEERANLKRWKIEDYREMPDLVREVVSKYEARLSSALAQVETLKSALEPFAAFAKFAVNEDGWVMCQNDRICDWFGPDELRRARSVYEETGE